MALQKLMASPFGVDGNYFKLTRVNVDMVKKVAFCELSLYLDKAARDAGAKALDSVQFDWSDAQGTFPFLGTASVYVSAYDQIKLDPAFSDAVDV